MIDRLPRSIFFVRLIVVLALVGTDLTGSLMQASSLAQEATEIRFAFWGDPAERVAYEAVVDAFESIHPDIDVTVDYTPGQGDYYRKVASDFAAGIPPDVFLTNYRKFSPYAQAGGLAPIQGYLDNSTAISESDYYGFALDAFRYGDAGSLYCLPQNISSLVVYYNEDLFRVAGLPLPTDGWGWDEFIAAAQALTRDTDGDGVTDQFGVLVEPSMYRMVSFIWGAGGEVVDDLEHPTRLTIDTPEALAGLQAFVGLGASGYGVVPPEAEVAAEADLDRFVRGGAGMYIQSRRPVPTLREIDGFDWDVVSLPVIAQPATVLHSDGFCMAASADNPDAAWSFIEFAGSAPGQLLLAETGRTVPSLVSVSQSDVFLRGIPLATCGDDCHAPSDPAASPVSTRISTDGLPPANAQTWLDNIAVMRRLPTTSTWVEVEAAFDAEFGRSLYIENFDVAAAAAAAIAHSQDALDRGAE